MRYNDAMSEHQPQKIFLSLGSNLGNREDNLRRAVELLQRDIQITAMSWLYETDPVGVTEQPSFLNLVVGGATSLEPVELLRMVKRIEDEVGRRPTYRWGPRILDIDILLYGDLVVDTPELVLPHREMSRRAFVLVPLTEIAPDVIEPAARLTVRQLCDRMTGTFQVRRLRPLAPAST